MTIGLCLTSRSRLPPSKIADLAEHAEHRGFGWIFINESGNDSLVTASIIAGSTSKINIGTGITNIYLRHPVLTAAGALEIAERSKGRFALGLGTGHRSVNEFGLGIKMISPLAQLKEYLQIVRKCLNEEKVDFEGDFYSAKDWKLMLPKVKSQIPIYMAVLGQKSAHLAGQIADGVILNFATPQYVADVAEILRKSAIEAGRHPDSLKIICYLQTIVAPSRDEEKYVLKAAKQIIGNYGRLSFYREMFAKIGFPINGSKLHLASNENEIAEIISDDLAKNVMLVGTPSHCSDRIDEYLSAGVQVPVIYPNPYQEDWEKVIREMIEIFSPYSQPS